MEEVLASREVLWIIPTSFKVMMYLFMFTAFGILAKGLWTKYQYVMAGSQLNQLLPNKLNIKRFLETIFFTGKVTRNGYVGFFHSLIYYGFIILTIATELVAIHADTPLQLFQGTTYIVVSFLADWAGLAIILGLGLAYKRRYIDKPDYLSATVPTNELFMYGMIFSLVFVGFLLEGLRLVATGMPVNEMMWSPVGWVVANILKFLNLSEPSLALTYKTLWLFHMINTMAFIASISHTKFFHIVIAPLNALLTPYRRGAVLQPMNFEDETKETFGLGKISELTPKQRMDTLACVECGRCTQVCPANLAKKPLNPKTIITKLRDEVALSKGADIDLWEKSIFSDVELDSCTTCGACMEECPMNIEHQAQKDLPLFFHS